MDEETKKRRLELCQKCYTCEKGVEKTVTFEEMQKRRADKCQKCYTCEQGVSADVSIDNGVIEVSPEAQKELTPKEKAEFCQKCYTCEKMADKGITRQQMEGGWESIPITYFLFPTNGCNLRCTYCYANNKPGKMTKETMHQVLRWLFEVDSHKNITCHFFGGEPIVMWDMMVDMIKIGTEMAKSNGMTVNWGMTTNGTLLDEDRLQWIVQNMRKGNPFLLSIDGRPETHNKHRVLAGGKPTHHLIPVDRILELFPRLECRPTIEPDTAKDWFEDFCYLRNKGFKHIAIEPDFECEWTVEQMNDYEETLRKLGQYYIYAKKLGKPMYMKFIDMVVGSINGTSPPTGRVCGVAWNSAGIDHRGKLYACQRYTSYNDPAKYAIGDVWNGWDEFKLFETQLLFRENIDGDATRGYNCNTCSIKNFCYKGCNAANCKWNKTREIALPTYCELTKREVRVALSVLNELEMLRLREGVGKTGQRRR
jgi:uncharacterized protein